MNEKVVGYALLQSLSWERNEQAQEKFEVRISDISKAFDRLKWDFGWIGFSLWSFTKEK